MQRLLANARNCLKFFEENVEKRRKTIEKISQIDYNNFIKVDRSFAMNFKAQQKEFDDVKWYDSIVEGSDRCGTYNFCPKCDKAERYPCARAKARYENGYTRIATVYCRLV